MSAKLKTIGILGKDRGISAKASALIEREPHLSDARVNDRVAFQADHGLRRARLDDEVAQDEGEGRTPRSRYCHDGEAQTTWRQWRGMDYQARRRVGEYIEDPLRLHAEGARRNEVGCVATHDPEFEIPHGFEDVVIDDTVRTIVWSGNEAFTKQGGVRNKPPPTYTDKVAHLLQFMCFFHAVKTLHPYLLGTWITSTNERCHGATRRSRILREARPHASQ